MIARYRKKSYRELLTVNLQMAEKQQQDKQSNHYGPAAYL